MKKSTLFRHLLLPALAVAISACGNLSNISNEGTTDNPIFPDPSKSVFKADGSQVGSWPNWENVRQIKQGMNKKQIYQHIGVPHFYEGFYGVREWDYVFNYNENGVHKMCQFKILFDKNMIAQSFFWYPNGCNSEPQFNLSGDFLFDFNQDALSSKGTDVVDNLAAQLKASGAQQVKIAGYTDRLGSVAYNIALSQRRANSVKARLEQQGVTAQMEAVGYGKANQVKACEGETGRALRDCLRPNRRVEIFVTGGELQQSESGNVAGSNGPAILYQTPANDTGK